MPMKKGGIWCQRPKVEYWARQLMTGPVTVFVVIWCVAVMPPSASAMTAVQSTAARSAGVRATFARMRARYDFTSFTNSVAENVVGDGIQVDGSGKPPAPPAAASCAARMARSKAARAESRTCVYAYSGPASSASVPALTMPAESYTIAM